MRLLPALLLAALGAAQPAEDTLFIAARQNGQRFDAIAAKIQSLLYAWLKEADPKTLLLPDRTFQVAPAARVYSPQHSGAELYSSLVLTAHLTDPELFHGRLLEMLRNELLYTSPKGSVPGELELSTGKLRPSSVAGAARYAKGLLSVTELLGRSPWSYRMASLAESVMKTASVPSHYGPLPSLDAEVNGILLQVLTRLGTMTGDKRYIEWAKRIGNVYVGQFLPGNHGLPGKNETHLAEGDQELIIGLTFLYAIDRDVKYEPAIRKMLDRVLESANPDGMLYAIIDSESLKPKSQVLTQAWGEIYGAVYLFYQCTSEVKYREAVEAVLNRLSKHKQYRWQDSSPSGRSKVIRGVLPLLTRAPVLEASQWLESEMALLLGTQKPSIASEGANRDGSVVSALIPYLLFKSQGATPDLWQEGVGLGAIRSGAKLYFSLHAPSRIRFDYARHRRVLNLSSNFARSDEFPEWFAVEESALYSLTRRASAARVVLGSELIAGVRLSAGEYTLEPYMRAASE